MSELDFGANPDNFNVVDLGREFTRKDAKPSQVHVIIEYLSNGDPVGKRAFGFGPLAIKPLESDLQDVDTGKKDEEDNPIFKKETTKEASVRLFLALHEQAGNITEALLTHVRARIDKNMVKEAW